MGFPGNARGKESACQYRRYKRLGFDPWVWKIPWRRKWQLTPIFLLGELHDRGAWRAIVHGVAESVMTDSLNIRTTYNIPCKVLEPAPYQKACP